MMTLVCGGELFTGNTCFLAAAVAEKKATMRDLVKNWTLSYAGNVVGTLFMVRFCYSQDALQKFEDKLTTHTMFLPIHRQAWAAFNGGTLGDAPAAAVIAASKCALPWKSAFIRAVMGNWIVCMSILMATGSRSLASKMVAIFFPISAFVMLGLEHSIANLFIVPLGMMRGGQMTTMDFLLKNLLPVTLGNIVGGALCVALSYSSIHGTLLDKKKDEK